MAAGKRVADTPPGAPPKHTEKKQKTAPAGQSVPTASALLKTPAAKAHTKTTKTKAQHIIPIRPETERSGFTVVPATPGTIVDLEVAKTKAAAKEAAKETQTKEPKKKPTTLPLEPHAAILADLQHKYAVRVLSVISSTRMEKRIKAVLEHLGGDSKPGVVLLHARAPDANKLVSIAEIVKRRIREGYFAGADKAMKKKTKKDAAAVAWCQYDRIYDVKTAKTDEASDQVDRLEAALTDETAPASKVTTYMSILLSRTPVGELHKNADVSVQCSTDVSEIEYERYMNP